MKNIRTIQFTILIICLLFISYCAGTQSRAYVKPPACDSLRDFLSTGVKLPDKGWSDGDTFWVITTGDSKPGVTDPAERKVSALRAAVFNAQYAAVKEFTAIVDSGNKSNKADGRTGSVSRGKGELVYPLAAKGMITCSFCNTENRCVILYTILTPSLKKTLKNINL